MLKKLKTLLIKRKIKDFDIANTDFILQNIDQKKEINCLKHEIPNLIINILNDYFYIDKYYNLLYEKIKKFESFNYIIDNSFIVRILFSNKLKESHSNDSFILKYEIETYLSIIRNFKTIKGIFIFISKKYQK